MTLDTSNISRPHRHSNPSKYGKARKGRFQFIHKKRRETKELLKGLLA